MAEFETVKMSSSSSAERVTDAVHEAARWLDDAEKAAVAGRLNEADAMLAKAREVAYRGMQACRGNQR